MGIFHILRDMTAFLFIDAVALFTLKYFKDKVPCICNCRPKEDECGNFCQAKKCKKKSQVTCANQEFRGSPCASSEDGSFPLVHQIRNSRIDKKCSFDSNAKNDHRCQRYRRSSFNSAEEDEITLPSPKSHCYCSKPKFIFKKEKPKPFYISLSNKLRRAGIKGITRSQSRFQARKFKQRRINPKIIRTNHGKIICQITRQTGVIYGDDSSMADGFVENQSFYINNSENITLMSGGESSMEKISTSNSFGNVEEPMIEKNRETFPESIRYKRNLFEIDGGLDSGNKITKPNLILERGNPTLSKNLSARKKANKKSSRIFRDSLTRMRSGMISKNDSTTSFDLLTDQCKPYLSSSSISQASVIQDLRMNHSDSYLKYSNNLTMNCSTINSGLPNLNIRNDGKTDSKEHKLNTNQINNSFSTRKRKHVARENIFPKVRRLSTRGSLSNEYFPLKPKTSLQRETKKDHEHNRKGGQSMLSHARNAAKAHVAQQILEHLRDKVSDFSSIEMDIIETRARTAWIALNTLEGNEVFDRSIEKWVNLEPSKKISFVWATFSGNNPQKKPFDNFLEVYKEQSVSFMISSSQTSLLLDAKAIWDTFDFDARLPFVLESFIFHMSTGNFDMKDEKEVRRIMSHLIQLN